MANWKVVVSGPAELSPVSEIHTVERRSDKTPDRRHVNVLLESSEEELMKDLEPHEYHCYQGWEEAVCGWAKVAPLASILLAEKTGQKPKRKDDSPTPAELDRFTEQPSEIHLRPPTRSSTISSQRLCTKSDASNPTPEIQEIPITEDISKTVTQLVLENQTRDARTPFQDHQMASKSNLADNRSPKPRKNSQRTNNALVPIKNFTFLPPIKMAQNQQQNISGNKHQLCETGMESFFIIDKINRIRQTKGDLVYTEFPKDTYNEAVSLKYRTCQHNPNYYSAVSVSGTNRYHVALSSKPETLHPVGYSVSKTLRSSTANRQLHMHPSYLYSS